MLARASHDDPVFVWFFPAEGSRHRRLRRFFATELRHESLRHGAVEVACRRVHPLSAPCGGRAT
jgi:hypothetical protein